MNHTVAFWKDRDFTKKLVKMALPIAFQNLMLASVAAADAIMLGNLEQNSMSAVSLATQIQFVQNILLSAAVAAMIVLCAQYWGKRELEPIKILFAMTFRLCGVASLLFFAGCVFFPRVLMELFTNEEVLIGIGAEYLRIAGWSYLITGISQCYLGLMKVSEHPASAARISTLAVILNILLNAVLIFGMFGLPAMGVRGAALATLISRVIELFVLVLVSRKPGFISPSFRDYFRTNRLLRKDLIKCMWPLVGAGAFWGIGFTSYTAFVGHLGVDAAGANSVAAVIRDLVCCMCDGLSAGGGILVGNELGAGDLKKGKLYGDRMFVIAFMCGLLSVLIMLIFTPAAMQLIRLTDGARKYLFGMMIIMSVYMIGRAVNTVIINGVFAAGGDTLFDMYSLAVTMWGIAVPLAALGTFVFHWPVLLVYACTCLDEVGKIPWVIWHYRKYKWVKDLTREGLE